jgi:hypothetical protein
MVAMKPIDLTEAFPLTAMVTIRPKTIDELPDHIKETPSPGHWVHVQGVDKAGDSVDFWCAVDAPADEEGGDNGLASLGRRIAEAAYAEGF